jgi:GAF domain-containing protein/two-component sensor histidine kinase
MADGIVSLDALAGARRLPYNGVAWRSVRLGGDEMSETHDTGPLAADGGSSLLDALARLNEVGASINRISGGDTAGLAAVLELIVGSAAKTVPGSSAVLYTYDNGRRSFNTASRVSAGESPEHPSAGALPWADDAPRPAGLGARAIQQLRPVLSYEERDLSIHPLKAAQGVEAVACLPLVVAEHPEGALYVYLHEDRPFTALELLLLNNLVNQAAIAIYHARQVALIQHDLARKQNELGLLHHAGLLISSRTRLEDTLDAILQMALEVTQARYGIFRLVDRTGEQLVTRAIAGDRLGRPATETLPINTTSVMGWVAKTRKSLTIPDVTQPPWSRIYYPLDHVLDMRSELAVPLIGAGGRLEGVLNLESPEVAAFTEADSHLLQSLASQAVIAIQEVRLLDALRDTAERLLHQPASEVLEHLTRLACDLLNIDGSVIWTREGEALIRRAVHSTDSAAHLPETPEEMIRRALLTASPLTYERNPSPAPGWTRGLVTPILSAPEQTPVGVLAVYTAGPREELAASEWDKKVIGILAHYAALALENETHQRALRAAEEARAVAETFAAMGDVAANLLHHLNNKVGTIPVRIEGIQDKCSALVESNAYLAANLAEIERAALDAMASVRERLSLLHPIDVAPTTIQTCVEDALARARLGDGITVQLSGLDTLPEVMAGREGLALALVNLLENAREAMKGQGHLAISAHAEPRCVELVIRDDGPGIPAGLQPSIFDFSVSFNPRADDASAKRSRLGFGLWWVKTLMTRLGGSVTVESDGQHGTAFHLRIPAARGPS